MTYASNRANRRVAHILLVEDSPTDRLITRSALEQAQLRCTVHAVTHGQDALAFLRREGRYADVPRPDLILLDLNLPRMSGRELLLQIKSDPLLLQIPVVVLTTSASPDDVLAAYGAMANSYVTKPVDFGQFDAMLQVLGTYWFDVVALPPEPPAPAEPLVPGTSGTPAIAVLLIEDSLVDAQLLRSKLQQSYAGALQIVHVLRLQEALERLAQEPFDVVITDLSLPDATGLQAVEELRRFSRGKPIIVLTGSYDPSLGEQALQQGAEDYLLKNEITGSGLARSIRYAMHRSSTRPDQRQQSAAVGQLAASVAHDFNNLLAVIHANAQVLAEGAAHTDTSVMLRDILESTTRGAALTRQLLAFGRRDRFDPRATDVNAVVIPSVDLLQRLARNAPEVSLRLEPALPTIQADANALEQLIVNLGLNAVDALPAGGMITIRTDAVTLNADAAFLVDRILRPGRYVRLAISDFGVEIPLAERDHIFEPFLATAENGVNRGLGLATVREIALQHGGTVVLASAPGAGTMFVVYLPAAGPVPTEALLATAPTDAAAAAAPAEERTTTILVVDDEEAVRRAISRVLTRTGYAVRVAESADAAWEQWSTSSEMIDLIVCDLSMPGTLSAIDFTARVRAARPEVPILFCSGYSDGFADGTLRLVEGDNFIPKPFSVPQLIDTVRRALG